jgi:hypothetical protein
MSLFHGSQKFIVQANKKVLSLLTSNVILFALAMGNNESHLTPAYTPLEPVVEHKQPTARDLIPDVAEASSQAAKYEAIHGPIIAAWLTERQAPGEVAIARHVISQFKSHLPLTKDGCYEVTLSLPDIDLLLFTEAKASFSQSRVNESVILEMITRKCQYACRVMSNDPCRYCDALRALRRACLKALQAAFEEKGYSWIENGSKFIVRFTPCPK